MKSPRIIIGALNCQANEYRRAAARSTWGHDVAQDAELDLVFLIGNPNLTLPQREGDVLYCPCPDDYISLPLKTKWFCLWALANGGDWRHLFKCDDDTYIVLDRLKEMDFNRAPVIGYDDGDHYHGGAGYSIDRKAALAIAAYMKADRPGLRPLEDWQSRDAIRKCGMNFKHDGRLRPWNNEPFPSLSNKQVTAHYVTPFRMRQTYDTFRTYGDAITIPKLLHFYWSSGELPPAYENHINGWRRLHPDWQVIIWNDETAAKEIRALSETFAGCSIPAQRSHIARYELLYKFGGVYVDCDMQPQKNIEPLLQGVTGFSASEDEHNSGIAVIGCDPQHPYMKILVEKLTESIRSYAKGGLPAATGSHFFTRNLPLCRDWRVFPFNVFYPIHWSGNVNASVTDAYAVHKWAKSWK